MWPRKIPQNVANGVSILKDTAHSWKDKNDSLFEVEKNREEECSESKKPKQNSIEEDLDNHNNP